MSGGRMSGGRMSGGRLSGGLMSAHHARRTSHFTSENPSTALLGGGIVTLPGVSAAVTVGMRWR